MNISVATPENRQAPQSAARPVSPLLYPILLIAGVSVIVASLLGIAAMTGLLPPAQSQPAVTAAATGRALTETLPASQFPKKVAAANAAQRAGDSGIAAARCENCGVVESVRSMEQKGEGSGVGAVAGGLVGGILGNQVGGGKGRTAMTVVGAGAGAYAGHELEKNMKRSVTYEIRVRMDDRSIRTFHSDNPDLGVGQRVTVRDGRLALAG